MRRDLKWDHKERIEKCNEKNRFCWVDIINLRDSVSRDNREAFECIKEKEAPPSPPKYIRKKFKEK